MEKLGNYAIQIISQKQFISSKEIFHSFINIKAKIYGIKYLSVTIVEETLEIK